MLPQTEEQLNKERLVHAFPYKFSTPGVNKRVNRSPGLASSYSGVFPSNDSDFMPFRQLHGYWDSPEISSAFPWHQYDASTFRAPTQAIHRAKYSTAVSGGQQSLSYRRSTILYQLNTSPIVTKTAICRFEIYPRCAC